MVIKTDILSKSKLRMQKHKLYMLYKKLNIFDYQNDKR